MMSLRSYRNLWSILFEYFAVFICLSCTSACILILAGMTMECLGSNRPMERNVFPYAKELAAFIGFR